MLSTNINKENLVKFVKKLDAGMNVHIAKPVNIDELEKALREILS